MKITIDESAGFCWGVVRTIEIVEECLQKYTEDNVYVLGHIIHNPSEIKRLEEKKLITTSKEMLPEIAPLHPKVIIRAHGEPPETYKKAEELNIDIIDATCPLVKTLQNKVRKYYLQGYQIVILGKKEHAEVIGLRGVCNDECIVIKDVEEAIEKIDFKNKTVLFSQTTMDKQTFYAIKKALEKKLIEISPDKNIQEWFLTKDTICKYVSERDVALKIFASENDIVLFVAGKNSSNGKTLFNICSEINSNTYFIENKEEIDYQWFVHASSVGITGATSTPQWYMQEIKEELENILNEN